MRLLTPDQNVLNTRCSEGSEVLVSVPFYSSESLPWVTPGEDGSLEFWTRLNPFDWATGASDPDSLLSFIETELSDSRVTLRAHRALHAKIYLVDDDWAWVGSANLTVSGFNRNIELVCELEGEEVASLQQMIDTLRPSMSEISAEELGAFLRVTEDVVEEHRERGQIEGSDEMQVAVDLADEVLGPETTWWKEVTLPALEEFVEFLEDQPEDAATVLVDRFNGANNLQGHMKQSYYGAMLYLLEPGHPDLREKLLEVSVDGMPSYEAETVRSWQNFLDRHAGVKDEDQGFSLSTLRRILPEKWGGYTVGGGGGASTLKRTLPLAARFAEERGIG